MALDRDILCSAIDERAVDEIKTRFGALCTNDASGESEQSAIAQFERAVCQIIQAHTDAQDVIKKIFNPN